MIGAPKPVRPFKPRLLASLFSVHKWLGLVTGFAFLLIAITGTLMIFMSELNIRGHQTAAPGVPLAHYAPAIADFVERHPGSTLFSIYVPAEKADRKTWQAFLRRSATDESRIVADFDPGTGRVVTERAYDSTLFHFLLKLHYSFLAGTVGELAAWCVSLALFLLSITGLWIYRGAIRDLFRWRVKSSASTRGNMVWLHKWTGLWALFLALTWGVTGFCYMLAIAPRSFKPPSPPPPATDPAALRALADLAAMHALTQAQFPGHPLVSVRPVFAAGKPAQVSFRYLLRDGAPWHKFGEVFTDAQTGAVAKIVRPHERSLRDKYFATLATLHFGFYGGRFMQVIWGLGGLVMIFLPLSGYAMWWLKRRRSRRTSALAEPDRIQAPDTVADPQPMPVAYSGTRRSAEPQSARPRH